MEVYLPRTLQIFSHKYCFCLRNKNISNCLKIKNGKVKCYKGQHLSYVQIHANTSVTFFAPHNGIAEDAGLLGFHTTKVDMVLTFQGSESSKHI
jgi:hypothetical protein